MLVFGGVFCSPDISVAFDSMRLGGLCVNSDACRLSVGKYGGINATCLVVVKGDVSLLLSFCFFNYIFLLGFVLFIVFVLFFFIVFVLFCFVLFVCLFLLDFV